MYKPDFKGFVKQPISSGKTGCFVRQNRHLRKTKQTVLQIDANSV